jgi:hypothetical protein
MNENRVVAITTIDNPYDPIDDFEHWYQFDNDKGYYTSSSIARLTTNKTGLTQEEIDLDTERAIDRLIELDPLCIYKKIVRFDKNND